MDTARAVWDTVTGYAGTCVEQVGGALPALIVLAALWFVVMVIGVGCLKKIAALVKRVSFYSPPTNQAKIFGIVTIPDGEQWCMTTTQGSTKVINGPSAAFVFGAHLTKQRRLVANESQYLTLQFTDGHTQVIPGPASIWEDKVKHQSINISQAVNLNSGEALVVYRSTGEQKDMKREIIRGPKLYVRETAAEYTHSFSWHGNDNYGGEILRKKPNALKFDKLQTTPAQTYFDIENVRTNDDALLVIRLMLFYHIHDIETMLDETKDPIADLINSVSSDVIEFTSACSFERFKESADKLNSLESYKILVPRAKQMGFTVTKVVFRGFMAPPRLQKMHDDAIERRTRLVLEGESEVQEQNQLDNRQMKQAERARKTHQMAKEESQHQIDMQRQRFEAEQRQTRETKEQEMRLAQAHRQQELQDLSAMKTALGFDSKEMARILVSRDQGAPHRLVQIQGAQGLQLHTD